MGSLPANLDFAVREEKVYNQHGHRLEGYKQLINETTNEFIHVHKDSYRVITHQDAWNATYQFMRNTFQMDNATYTFNGSSDGSILHANIKLEHYKVPYRDTEIGLQVNMWNSYNGSRRFLIMCGFYLIICTNGLVSSIWDVRLGHQHKGSGEINLGTLSDYDVGDKFKTVSNYMENWGNCDISDNDLDYQTDILCLQPTMKDKSHVNQQHKTYILDEYNKNYSKKYGDNKFSAYQAMTHWSTHYPSDSINTRYDRERKVANFSWFSNAA